MGLFNNGKTIAPPPSQPAGFPVGVPLLGFSLSGYNGINHLHYLWSNWGTLPIAARNLIVNLATPRPVPGIPGYYAHAIFRNASGATYRGILNEHSNERLGYEILVTDPSGQFAQLGPYYDAIDVESKVKEAASNTSLWHDIHGGGFLNGLHNALRSVAKAAVKSVAYVYTAPLELAPKGSSVAKATSTINSTVVNNPLTTVAVVGTAAAGTLAAAPEAAATAPDVTTASASELQSYYYGGTAVSGAGSLTGSAAVDAAIKSAGSEVATIAGSGSVKAAVDTAIATGINKAVNKGGGTAPADQTTGQTQGIPAALKAGGIFLLGLLVLKFGVLT